MLKMIMKSMKKLSEIMWSWVQWYKGYTVRCITIIIEVGGRP